MGRMSEARKRARRQPDPELPSPAPLESAAAAAIPGSPRAEVAAKDDAQAAENIVFPADEESAPAVARLTLPASGTAEEILASAEAAAFVASRAIREAPARVEPADPITFGAVAAARGAREEKREHTEHLATFILGREEYGVEVRLVQEIIRVTPITRVPRTPGFIKGVINLRGRVIPVIDLKAKLGLGEVETGSKKARIVVANLDGRLFGLLVDAASQVQKIPGSAVEPVPEEVVEVDSNSLRGVAKLEGRLVILMDLKRALAAELRETTGPRASGPE
jgi:purine-binding chemotaxis protein CheW